MRFFNCTAGFDRAKPDVYAMSKLSEASRPRNGREETTLSANDISALVRDGRASGPVLNRLRYWAELCQSEVVPPNADSPYTPPEVTGVVSPDTPSRASVYTLGMLGYTILSEGHPWSDYTAEELRHAIVARLLPPLRNVDLPSGIRGRINRIIERATSKDPASRFGTAGQLRSELQSAIATLTEASLSIRHAEFCRIERWLEDFRAGGTGILQISGNPGMGKTYLWETVVDNLAEATEAWLYVKAGQVERRPYQTITRLLESEAERVAELISLYPEFAALSSLVRSIAPALVPLIPETPHQTTPPVPEPAVTLARLVSMLGDGAVRIFCFDDYQWLDQYSRAVVDALMGTYDRTAVVIITRNSVDSDETLPCSVTPAHLERLHLGPLDRSEVASFVKSLRPEVEPSTERTVDEVWEGSLGNPMAMVALLSGAPAVAGQLPHDTLAAVARERIKLLSAEATRLTMGASLVGTPVNAPALAEKLGIPSGQLTSIVAEVTAARIMAERPAGGYLQFVHDSIDEAARSLGMTERSVRTGAAQFLLSAGRRGDHRATRLAAELIMETSEAVLPPDDRDWILLTAARDSLEALAPHDALDIVERSDGIGDPAVRVSVGHVGHEAAYLLGDHRRMSHFYRLIVAEGSELDRAQALYMWIRRNYADARFTSAARITSRILDTLEVLDPRLSWFSGTDEAVRRLRKSSPERWLRRVIARGPTSNPTAAIASKSLAHMFLSTMTSDPERLVVAAYYMLRIAERHGWTPHTGLGFIAWGAHLGISRPPGRWLRSYFQCAESLSVLSDDQVAQHTIRMLITGLGSHWWQPYTTFRDKLSQREQEGRVVANWEYVAHARHLHAQAMLHSGAPLQGVCETFEDIRREVAGFGLQRTEHALKKHHQAAEALLGEGSDPTKLDGRIINEERYYQSLLKAEDTLSLAGFFIVKSLVLFYADRPDLVIEKMRRVENAPSSVSIFHDTLVGLFLTGAAAYRTGDTRRGSRALRQLRRLAREVPETNLHRKEIVLAERAAAAGRRRVAARLFHRAGGRAISLGYVHEAGYANERLGDITGDRGHWHQAESLYRAWGAGHAVDRVRLKLGLPDEPARSATEAAPVDTLPSRLAASGDIEEFAELLAQHLLELTSASQIVMEIRAREASIEHITTRASDETQLPRSDHVAPDLQLLLDESEIGKAVNLGPDELAGRVAPALTMRGRSDSGNELAVVLLGAQQGARFSAGVARQVGEALKRAVQITESVALRDAVKRIRNELSDTSRALSQTEEYRRQLFSAVDGAFLLIDRNGSVLYSNLAASHYLRHTDGGTPVLRPELRLPLKQMMSQATAHHAPPARQISLENKHLLMQLATVGDAEELTAVGVYDVTEMVTYQEELAQKERQLIISDRLASIGMFSSAIFHEISNPNHILQLNTQSLAMIVSMLRDERTPGEGHSSIQQLEKLAEQIQDAAGRIDTVLQTVKSYAREGRTDQWEFIDPAEVCRRAVNFSRIMAYQYTDHFTLSVGDKVPRIWGDAGLLEQAVVNLIKNACNALPTRVGKVHVSAEVEGGEFVIAVSDTGVGFPKHVKQQLGKPFVTESRAHGGTGLGLSIVSGIVEQHGGRLVVTEPEAFTTAVRIELPVPEA